MGTEIRFTGMLQGRRPASYVITEDDARVVDFAIRLGRPLLVEGEAGCGKTRLAYAIADELGHKLPLAHIPVRSTSRAKDLLYSFDAFRRLQDSQIERDEGRAKWAHNYVRLEALGRAILESEERVILVDEVDKADFDFANDLLDVLERFSFHIDEIHEDDNVRALTDRGFGRFIEGRGPRPIIVFTSNRERPLPKPFLRRCLYLELNFPSRAEELAEIVALNLKRRQEDGRGPSANIEQVSERLIQKAVKSFLEIRAAAERNSATKKPATAELIDWIHVLHWHPEVESRVQGLTPPFWRILFSSSIDIETHRFGAPAQPSV